jgi:hypothetical protein
LEARGHALKVENFQALKEIEDQIEAIKPYQYHADIVGAFITYESNEDIRKIQSVFGPKNGKATEDMQVERAVDPSNIKWKNMQIKTNEKFVRGLLVLLSLLALLYFSFLMQVVLNDERFETKSFEKIDCKAITDS